MQKPRYYLPPLLLLASCSLSLTAQTPSATASPQPASHPAAPPASAPEPDSIAALPATRVTFEESKPVPGGSSNPLMMNPIFCTSDGAAIGGRLVKDSIDIEVDAVPPDDPGKMIAIRKSAVPGFKNLQFTSYFADDSRIVAIGGGVTTDQADLIRGWKQYLFVFNRKGAFQKTVELDLPFTPRQIAIFPSGKFLMNGQQLENNLPRLAIVNEDGTLARYIDTDLDTPRDIEKAYAQTFTSNGSKPHTPEAADLLASQQFVPYRDHLLLFSGGSKLPILEVSDAGVQRSVQINLPLGLQIDYFVPSTVNLMAWIRRPSKIPGHKDEVFLVEINPNTGDLVRQFVSDAPFPVIACAIGNTFAGFDVKTVDKIPHLGIEQGSY